VTALFALATSLLWGLADFGGGLLNQRTGCARCAAAGAGLALAGSLPPAAG